MSTGSSRLAISGGAVVLKSSTTFASTVSMSLIDE